MMEMKIQNEYEKMGRGVELSTHIVASRSTPNTSPMKVPLVLLPRSTGDQRLRKAIRGTETV